MGDAENHLLEVVNSIAEEQGYSKPEVEVKAIDSGGANYSSRLFAVTISGPGKSDLKLFSKVATLGEKIRSLMDVQLYDIEIDFYTKILFKYRELEDTYKIPASDKLVTPKYYGGSSEYLKETIVLEELTSQEYQFFDRFKCFDWEYASECVSQLASLHALSAAHQKYYPAHFEDTMKGIKIQFSPSQLKLFMEKNITNAIDVTEEAYKNRLKRYFEKEMTDENIRKFFHSEKRIILNHGDFRPSNILHKKNKDGKLSVMLVDYQTIQLGNPVKDLVYFLICGSDEEFRSNYLQQLFDHYYAEFSRKLRGFELDPEGVYSREEYRKDVKEILPFGVVLGMFVLPIVTVEEEDAPKPSDGIDMDSFRMGVNELFRSRFTGLVRDYVQLGIL